MTDRSVHVYVVQGCGQRDYADCQAALAHVPARMTVLSGVGDEDDLIARTRDADDRRDWPARPRSSRVLAAAEV